MARVRRDTRGRLLELLAPAQSPSSSPLAAGPRWENLLADAGLDPAALHPAQEPWLPPMFADTATVFTGEFPEEPTIPLRVELASYADRPVAFRLRGPWDDPAQSAIPSLGLAGVGALYALLAPALVLALLLGRRNIRLGRSDRRGGFRLALFTLGCDLLYALLRYGRADSALGEWFLVADSIGTALFDASVAWILYVALEPFVRRRWPEGLVSWSRILSGRFADHLVGRDILVAALAAGVSVALFALAQQAPSWLGRSVAPPLLVAYLDFLLGPSRQLAWLAGFAAVTAVVMSLTIVLLFVLLKALLRNRAAAAAAVGLVYASVFVLAVRPWPEQLPFYVGMAAVVAWVVARHGLLALTVMYFFAALLFEPLATTRLGAWHGQPALLSYALAAALLAWGLYTSLAGRSLGWEQRLLRSLED